MQARSEVNSDNSHGWLPCYALFRREVLRFFDIISQTLITPIITASLYLLIFGVSLGERISVLEGFSYLEFVVPGLIIMGIAQNAFQNTSGSLFMARYLGYIQDILVAPITPAQIILAYTAAAMIRGLLVGSAVLFVSCFFSVLPWESALAGFLLAVLTSFLFSQVGLIAAVYSHSFDHLAMFSNFLLLPLIYLGGLFYPISMLPGWWGTLSKLNPLYYIIEGFRGAALGAGEVNIWLSFTVSGAISLVAFFYVSHLILKSPKFRT